MLVSKALLEQFFHVKKREEQVYKQLAPDEDKKRTMKHQLLLFLSIGIIFFFVLLNIELPKGGITGAAIVEETEDNYALKLSHLVNNFFEVNGIIFPLGDCGDITREMYKGLTRYAFSETAGYGTNGYHRLASISFDIDELDAFGTIDMAKGETLLKGDDADSFISINSEAIIRVPKELRSTFFLMDLYGNSGTYFTVTRGSFSTPSVECSFITRDGQAVCDCNVHSIYGIRTGGITGVKPFPNNKV